MWLSSSKGVRRLSLWSVHLRELEVPISAMHQDLLVMACSLSLSLSLSPSFSLSLSLSLYVFNCIVLQPTCFPHTLYMLICISSGTFSSSADSDSTCTIIYSNTRWGYVASAAHLHMYVCVYITWHHTLITCTIHTTILWRLLFSLINSSSCNMESTLQAELDRSRWGKPSILFSCYQITTLAPQRS